VSSALALLTAEGELRREGRRWVLLGDPPAWEEDDVEAKATSN
jgi:hypothetical protein